MIRHDLAHKLREAMAEEMKGRVVGGEGKVAEVDAGLFGGYVRPANLAAERVDRRFRYNNHEEAYSLDGACTNMAEEYFSRLRRAEAGHHHHIAGVYLLRYAQEASWRENNRRMSNGDQMRRLTQLVTMKPTSPDFVGYWQHRYTA